MEDFSKPQPNMQQCSFYRALVVVVTIAAGLLCLWYSSGDLASTSLRLSTATVPLDIPSSRAVAKKMSPDNAKNQSGGLADTSLSTAAVPLAISSSPAVASKTSPDNAKHQQCVVKHKYSAPSRLYGVGTGAWPELQVDTIGQKLVQLGHSPFVSGAQQALLDGLDEFIDAYKHRPFRRNKCGIKIQHSFFLWTLIRALKPTTIIESGINKGQSTYFMRKASPTARIISIDPRAHNNTWCRGGDRWVDKTNNEYFTGHNFTDFAEIDWSHRGDVEPSSTLAFFDDHQNALKRIPILQKHGIRHAIFEDNYEPGKGDLHGFSMKQVLGRCDKDSLWLKQQLGVYMEFPPMFTYFPPKIKMNSYCHCIRPGDAIHNYPEPLLRPELRQEDMKVFERLDQPGELSFDDRHSELYHYIFFAYLQIAPPKDFSTAPPV